MQLTEKDLLGAVSELKAKGFTDDFSLEGETIRSAETGKSYKDTDFKIINAYSFDITENAVDTQNLYVIETADGKGLLVDMLAGYLYVEDGLIPRKIDTAIEPYISEDLPVKYGMEKIYKDRFDKNPGNYELRVGFPDFPACPFGNSFSMLGYDRENEKYVWLVTSILKDKRLETVHHQS